jgi:hypothetical protein
MLSVFCGPLAPVCAVAAAAASTTFVAGVTSGNLGYALKAGLIAGVTAMANFGVGAFAQGLGDAGYLVNAAGRALVGCGSAAASGGKCGPGALAGGVSALASPLTNGHGLFADLVMNSTVGGLASVAGGGKFANGAVTGAFAYLFSPQAQASNKADDQAYEDDQAYDECKGCTLADQHNTARQMLQGLGGYQFRRQEYFSLIYQDDDGYHATPPIPGTGGAGQISNVDYNQALAMVPAGDIVTAAVHTHYTTFGSVLEGLSFSLTDLNAARSLMTDAYLGNTAQNLLYYRPGQPIQNLGPIR